jgi:hypothetical protein
MAGGGLRRLEKWYRIWEFIVKKVSLKPKVMVFGAPEQREANCISQHFP